MAWGLDGDVDKGRLSALESARAAKEKKYSKVIAEWL